MIARLWLLMQIAYLRSWLQFLNACTLHWVRFSLCCGIDKWKGITISYYWQQNTNYSRGQGHPHNEDMISHMMVCSLAVCYITSHYVLRTHVTIILLLYSDNLYKLNKSQLKKCKYKDTVTFPLALYIMRKAVKHFLKISSENLETRKFCPHFSKHTA